MRAIAHDTYGDASVLELRDVRRPVPGERDLLIRVHTAGIDAGVWHLLAGTPSIVRPFLGMRGPRQKVRGIDVAGVVEQVGARVSGFAVGDEVLGTSRSGSFAEYALGRPERLAIKPDGVTWEAAAATPISGGTALQAVKAARIGAGDQVLVTGASGGVGSFAVQLAAARGATVTAVCSAAKAEFVRALGASRVLDYRTENFADAGVAFDAIVDIAGTRPLTELRGVLAARGTLVIVGGEQGGAVLGGLERTMAAGMLSPFIGQKLIGLVSSERAADYVELAAMIAVGTLTPAIDRVVSLADAAAGVRALQAGELRGKAVVRVAQAGAA